MTETGRTPREELSHLIKGNETTIDLARAALLMAQDEYPTLAPQPYLDKLAAYSSRVTERLSLGRDPIGTIAALNGVLFDEEGFKGNSEEYYDPRNSFLNEVLDRRVGIPITLSLLYMEVARRADIPLVGIGLPGHFITGLVTPGRTFYVDPFHQGQLLNEKECAERVAKIFDGKMPLTPAHFTPIGPRGILLRVLINLKNIYMESRSFAKGHAVIDKMVLLAPEDWSQIRDRGLVRYHLKHLQPALADLELYLRKAPNTTDRSEILKLQKIIMKELK
ncbi:MAG: transglutaminase family protein [Elusimicrobia bacterium]|nr:transglutaminase family protein [Elusimicrobiota bacterium]